MKQIKYNTVLQFKITLNYSEPKIWRRILVPVNFTFFDLYCAIENAMGWAGGHLHAFYIEDKKTKHRVIIQSPNPEDDDNWDGFEVYDERKEKIADFFGIIMKQCIYTYDFGDSWDHTVLFEREVSVKPGIVYPQCIAGGNACPPEDCGGLGGYYDLLEILKNPLHPEHQSMLEWLYLDDPKEFNLHEFDPREVFFEDSKKRLAEWNERFGI